jgi:UDP-N-acetylmuramoylalanine--D-glutamate ligase
MKITIFGLGLFGGGTGAARYFAEHGHSVSVTDLKSEKQLAPALKELHGLSVRYFLGSHPDSLFKDADVVVVNPAVKPDSPQLWAAQTSGAKLTTEINMVFELAKAPIAGVTGSNGKSTVAAMLAAILRKAGRPALLGGNLGGSLLGEVEGYPPDGVIVMELSSFQLARLEWIKRSPKLAVVTNVTPNHLDWHPDFEDYARAKEKIARYQTKEDFLVLNADCPVCAEWPKWAEARVARFSAGGKPTPPAAWLDGGSLLLDLGAGPREFLSAGELSLPGRHNLTNALAAALGAALLGANPSAARAALSEFKGLPHRLEFVAEKAGVHYYNDSIATTPESAIAALHSFDRPVALIAGGSDKGVAYAEFGKAVAMRADFVALTGPTATKIRAAIEAAGPVRVRIANAVGFDEAFRLAAAAAKPGWAVLLSPASASFNEFPNFERRGERFRELVRGWGGS